MSGGYYDRDGKPMTMMQWSERFSDTDYKVVASDEVGGYRVSTVWLGSNHQFGEGPPLIFETMVFGGAGWADRYCDRYATEDEARAGHDRVVAGLRDCTLELY